MSSNSDDDDDDDDDDKDKYDNDNKDEDDESLNALNDKLCDANVRLRDENVRLRGIINPLSTVATFWQLFVLYSCIFGLNGREVTVF